MRLAERKEIPVASASLNTQLSRWENGHATLGYQALLCEAVDAEDSLSIRSALGDAVHVLQTADERFVDRDGFPLRPRSQPHTTIVGADHFVQEDRPKEVANLLLNFIEA